MNSASPDAENDDLQPASDDLEHSPVKPSRGLINRTLPTESSEQKPNEQEPSEQEPSEQTSSPAVPSRFNQSNTIATLQSEYIDQLSQDIEQLEAEKAELQKEISKLKQERAHLQAQTETAQSADPPGAIASAVTTEEVSSAQKLPPTESEILSTETIANGPILPGEKEPPPSQLAPSPPSKPPSQERSIELPTPSTSEQQRQLERQLVAQRQRRIAPITKANTQRGLMLSGVATLLTAWHYNLIHALHQGGSWLGTQTGQINLDFVPAVGLIWLRMLVIVPALVFLAPKLHRTTWEDLQDWFYHDDQRFIPLVGSGLALFFSQVFLYQSIGSTGAVVGSALLFLYPLTATPFGLTWIKERSLTPFGLLSLVAIAMGGLLLAKPALSTNPPTGILLGLLASILLSIYITLTNLSYKQQCHPIPTAVIQFSTVAVLSSLVLLVKPLTVVNITWLSFCLWGLLLGVLMLITYFFTYGSLRLINHKTTAIAATTPLIVLLLSWSFLPQPNLAIIQWTGILLISIGGIAISQEKIVAK